MKYALTLNGKNYEVEVELAQPMGMDEFAAYAPAAPAPVEQVIVPAAAPAAAAAPTDGTCVKAPMPGTILKVHVTPGKAVKAGDVLCILEAMKMENEIMAPCAGTVKQVLAAKGSAVDTDAPLVVIG